MIKVNEQVLQGARHMFDLALEHCGACQNYHGLRGYLLATETVFGSASGAVQLRAVMAALAAGRPRVLIAGSADTGLISLVCDAYEGHLLHATIVDRCTTPLKLCDEFAACRNLDVRCVQGDLETFTAPDSFDLVFAHLVLGFMTPDQRSQTLNNWAESLAPGGKLVLATNLNSQGKGAKRVAELLQATEHGFPFELPEALPKFRERLQKYIDEKDQLQKQRNSLAGLYEEVEQAGFTAEILEPQEEPSGFPVGIIVAGKR